MAAIERLLVAEDDPPLRLVSLALGEALDEKMRVSVSRFFTDPVDTSLAKLRAFADDCGLTGQVVPRLAEDGELGPQLAGVQYLLVEGATVTAEALAHGTDLRLIQKHGEDCRNIDLEAARRQGVPVKMLLRRGNSDVAEHTLLLMLSVARRALPAHTLASALQGDVSRDASFYNWARMEGVVSLRERTLGLVGLGEIGRDVARKARPFGMRVLYTQRRQLEPEVEAALQVEYRTLPALLAESDVLSLHLPLTPETRGMIGPEQLAQMRPGAFLINTSRGALIDEAAVIAALESGRLGGVGLDVRPQEPPLDTPALTGLPNVVLTPHIGAGTGAALLADAGEVLRNIAAIRSGEH